MFKSFFGKIGTFLKVAFSWKRIHSPNSRSKAKTKQGHAGSTSGNHSPLYIVDIDNHFAERKRETTAYSYSWETLLKSFSQESGKRFANMLNDPKSKDPQKLNLNGHKKWISAKFKDIDLDHYDPRSIEFNRIRKEAITSIETLYKSGEQSQFEKDWANYLQDLETIKDI